MGNDAGYQQAYAWAQSQLAGGIDPEALVAGLMNQGWPELQARQVLDAALTNAAPVAAVAAGRARPVVQYATPTRAARPARSPYVNSGGSSKHATNMVLGGIICAVGVVITVGTYAAASTSGGHYTIAYGAVAIGFLRFITGFFGWVGER